MIVKALLISFAPTLPARKGRDLTRQPMRAATMPDSPDSTKSRRRATVRMMACIDCNDIFPSTRNTQVRCPNCNKSHRKKMAREYGRKFDHNKRDKTKRRALARARYWKDPDASRARERARIRKPNHERSRAAGHRHYWKDIEKSRVLSLARYYRRRDKALACIRKRYWNDPETARARIHHEYWKDVEHSRARDRAWYTRNNDKIALRKRNTRRRNLDLYRARARNSQRKRRQKNLAQIRLMALLEKILIRSNLPSLNHKRKESRNERNRFRRALLVKARELGIITKAMEESLQ
jgi:predicted RNA-binding Zn-ribbon protein involved in translation (DUF1610 family)